MNKLRELENPDAIGINTLYYKGEKKREFLKNKKQVLSQIPKGSILGMGYTITGIDLHDGCSLEHIEHSDSVSEYVFIKSFIKGDDSVYFEKISELVFDSQSTHGTLKLDTYTSELDKMGYVQLPITFRWQRTAEDITEDFGLVQSKNKKVK